jgi:hypothetical protein
MNSRVAAIVFRLVFAALALVAVGVQFTTVTLVKGHSIPNFFSYFTNLSNIFISIVFIVSAVSLARSREPRAVDTAIRGAAVVYIAFVGLVFNTLLRDAELGDLIPWVNAVVHFVLPIVAVIDWLIWPPRRPLAFRLTFAWMIFPALYVAYSLIRGAAIGFYPYPFFNPAVSGGYPGVAAYCAIMLVGFFVLSTLVWWLGNLGHRRIASGLPALRG